MPPDLARYRAHRRRRRCDAALLLLPSRDLADHGLGQRLSIPPPRPVGASRILVRGTLAATGRQRLRRNGQAVPPPAGVARPVVLDGGLSIRSAPVPATVTRSVVTGTRPTAPQALDGRDRAIAVATEARSPAPSTRRRAGRRSTPLVANSILRSTTSRRAKDSSALGPAPVEPRPSASDDRKTVNRACAPSDRTATTSRPPRATAS